MSVRRCHPQSDRRSSGTWIFVMGMASAVLAMGIGFMMGIDAGRNREREQIHEGPQFDVISYSKGFADGIKAIVGYIPDGVMIDPEEIQKHYKPRMETSDDDGAEAEEAQGKDRSGLDREDGSRGIAKDSYEEAKRRIRMYVNQRSSEEAPGSPEETGDD